MIHVADAPKPQRVILLPGSRSLRGRAGSTISFLRALDSKGSASALKLAGGLPVKMKVLDSIHDDGAKLVEITAEEAQKLRAVQPGLLMVPERFFDRAVQMYRVENLAKAAAARGTTMQKFVVKVISQTDGSPVAGANVVAFTDFAARTGAGGVTSKSGTVKLTLPSNFKALERMYVYRRTGFGLPFSSG